MPLSPIMKTVEGVAASRGTISRIRRIAGLEPVRMVYETLPLRTRAEETTTTLQTGQYNAGATPYHDAGIDGSGTGIGSPQILMVLDTGIQLDAAPGR